MAEKTATKEVNYTAEQTAEIVEAYKAMLAGGYTAERSKECVAALAEKLGKTTRSIVAKLSREKVYHSKEYVTKKGEKPEKKDNLADAIGKVLGLSDGETDSLTKVNKTALQKIFAALANSKPIDGNE